MANDRIILDRDQAGAVDGSGLSDVLTAGYFIEDATRIIRGFVAATHTLALITNAAAVRALNMVYAAKIDPRIGKDLAIWKAYHQNEGETAVFAGYLTITLTSGGTVCTLGADSTLGDETIDQAVFTAVTQEFIGSPDAPVYENEDDIATDVGAAGDKMHFAS